MRPVYVCSKGRPDGKTFALLEAAGVDYAVMVEPQDLASYQRRRIHPLPMDGQGLAYSRQAALAHARRYGIQWYWMLDDDISGFYRTNAETRKNEPLPADEALTEAEEWTTAHDTGTLGIVALEYQQFAWNATPGRPTWNSYTDIATLINADVLADYRQELPLKVDRDFTLQVLSTGYDVARLRWLSFAVPTNGTNEGGLHDRYAEGIEKTASERMEQLWPGVCEAKVKPNGRPDVKIHWRRMRSNG